tara:strand:+ start:663 stop:893 length:231 start_codon:yes stop_codon:yes gene_type:complete
MKPKYPEQWSLIEVQLTGGHTVALNVAVGPGIAEHFADKMRATGFLTIRNTKEAITIAAANVVAVKITLITTGDKE